MTASQSDDEGIRARTARRLVGLERDVRDLDARDAELSRFRGVAFLVFGGLSLVGLFRPTPIVWSSAGLAALVFTVFVVRHARVATDQFELSRRVELVRRTLARAEGTFRAPESEAHRRGDGFLTPGHPYASDLDLFGKGSLFEQCNVTHTPAGEERLAAWLSTPADAETILARQVAARELAEDEEFREALALAGMRAAKSSPLRDQRGVLEWAKGEAVAIPAVAVSVLLLVQLALGAAAALGLPGVSRAWGLSVLVQIVVMTTLRGRLEAVLAAVAVKQAPLGGYPDAMALVERKSVDAPALQVPNARLVADGGAAMALAKLDKLLGFAAVRHNGLVHVLANVFLMWDVFAAARLEGWRRAYGSRVKEWLDALAEVEALAALGTFAAEHPTFAWPTVEPGGARFVATGLGHPLVPASKRVTNDVDLETVRALMITGSNMSGKSTMLRSMGVAAALAQAGAPVCASALRMSGLRVWTSMRLDDSLSEGASHFFAEVRRLKAVVDAVREADQAPVFFLLDEVLHGTNSRERIVGAKAVVRHLVDSGARGAVSSHDLGLVVLETETGERVRNVHFQEHVKDGTMAFDYRMRPGPVATSNALRLMRQVGIDVVPDDAGEPFDSAAGAT